jgi:hypothetical protein
MDTNGDGRFDYGGATLYLTASQIVASPGVLAAVLPDANQGSGDLQVVASNCGSLVHGGGSPADSLINAGDKVYFAFNQPVLPGSVAVTVLGDDGKSAQGTVEPATTPSLFDFVPGEGFVEGHGYQLTIYAIASDSRPQVQKAFTGYCFANTSGNDDAPNITHAYYAPDAAGKLSPFATIQVELDSMVGVEGSAPQLAGYIQAELNSPADNRATSQGEYDSTNKNTAGGFLASPDPSKPVFNGFTRFFVLTYAGQATLNALKPFYMEINDPYTPGTGRVEWVNGTSLTGPQLYIGPLQMQPAPSP